MCTSGVLDALSSKLLQLTASQRDWLIRIVDQFSIPRTFTAVPSSDIATPAWVEHFGNALLVHHAMSAEDFKKEKFEFAFIFACRQVGSSAEKAASNTNRGHDITVDGIPLSLKTQADAAISPHSLHISKFHELGKDPWELGALLMQFLEHLKGYQRIFVLRSLLPGQSMKHYELVEIPLPVLLEATTGALAWATRSKAREKGGYCYVPRAVGKTRDERKSLRFQLYFDGGSERKLQLQLLRKDLCRVHAEWRFETTGLFEAAHSPSNAISSSGLHGL